MTTARLTRSDLRSSERIFSEELKANPWVLFHGTSSMNAAVIEEDGLRWTDALYTPSDLLRMLDICKSMNWEGIDWDAYSTLKELSLPRLNIDQTPPVYLNANPWKAASFSAHRIAGGETRLR